MTIFTKNNFLKLTLFAIVTIALINPAISFAQATPVIGNPKDNPPNPGYTPLEPLPCIPGGGLTCNTTGTTTINFQNYVQYVFNLAIFLAAAAAVFMIVWGGFEYMTTDSWQNKSDGLKKVKNALLGLILVLSSYLLLRTIDPRLVSIPSTLVKPLDIKYQNTGSALLDSLQTQADQFFATNAAAKAQISSYKSDLDTQNAQQASIKQQIFDLANNLDVANDDSVDAVVDQMCGNTGGIGTGPDMRSLCLQLVVTKVKISDDNANIRTSVGQGAIAGEISKCLANNTSADECEKLVTVTSQQASSQLSAMSRSTLPITDYAAYSIAMMKISKDMSAYATNGSVAVDVTNAITSSTGGQIALNAILPGGSLIATSIKYTIPNSSNSAGTFKDIQSIANNAQLTITDPALKAQLSAQVAAIKTTLKQ